MTDFLFYMNKTKAEIEQIKEAEFMALTELQEKMIEECEDGIIMADIEIVKIIDRLKGEKDLKTIHQLKSDLDNLNESKDINRTRLEQIRAGNLGCELATIH